MPGVTPRATALGDLWSDLQSLMNAATSFSQTGSLGPWLSQTLVAFDNLPDSVRVLRAQARAVQDTFRRAGLGDDVTGDLAGALQILTQIEARYPAVQQRVQQMTMTLAPVMAKVYAGQIDADVLARISASGLDVVGTIHGINGLLGQRDDAQELIQRAVTNPMVGGAVRNDALTAMAGAGSLSTIQTVAVLGIGALIIGTMLKAPRGRAS